MWSTDTGRKKNRVHQSKRCVITTSGSEIMLHKHKSCCLIVFETRRPDKSVQSITAKPRASSQTEFFALVWTDEAVTRSWQALKMQVWPLIRDALGSSYRLKADCIDADARSSPRWSGPLCIDLMQCFFKCLKLIKRFWWILAPTRQILLPACTMCLTASAAS